MFLPLHFDALADLDIGRRITYADDVGKYSGSLVQIDPRHRIGDQVPEEGVITLTHDAVGIDSAFATRNMPTEAAAGASGTVPPRVEYDAAAVVTLLVLQFPVLGGLPEFPGVVFVQSR